MLKIKQQNNFKLCKKDVFTGSNSLVDFVHAPTMVLFGVEYK